MSSNDNEKYVAGLDLARFPAGAREVLIALGQFQDDVPIDQRCPVCDGAISVEPLPKDASHPTAWRTSCACGKCSGTFRGL